MVRSVTCLLVLFVARLIGADAALVVAQPSQDAALRDLWAAGKPAFGVFVPNENRPISRGASGAESTYTREARNLPRISFTTLSSLI